jgi:HEPN domain-containing protein
MASYVAGMADRSMDWFRQAERDLELAEAVQRLGRHEWACFASHQGAEKAVRALHLCLGQEAWGHTVAKLLQELPDTVGLPDGLVDRARMLDNFYVPTRYPNGHPEGAPFEHYGPLQSEQGVDHARSILDFVRSQMA